MEPLKHHHQPFSWVPVGAQGGGGEGKTPVCLPFSGRDSPNTQWGWQGGNRGDETPTGFHGWGGGEGGLQADTELHAGRSSKFRNVGN